MVRESTLAVASTANEFVEWSIIAAIFSLFVFWIASALPVARDREWLAKLIGWGFVAKLVGSLARHFMTVDLYGYGDAFRYHGRGVPFADIWRSLTVPISTAGGEGTAFTEVATGLVYSIYTPTIRGGFLFFAFIGFLGQVLFYAAFRPWLRGRALKRYAIVMFFFPSIVFWTASVGKDALMIFFAGLAAWGISRLLRKIEVMGLVTAALGLYLTAQIRPHIAAMLALAAVLAFLFMKREAGPSRGVRRLVPLLAAIGGLVFAWGALSADFGVSLEATADTHDPAAFLDQVSNQTAQGGSQVSGGVVEDPLDIPAATLKVLFRPLIFEGTSPAIIVSALEGTALLLVVIWKLPWVWRNRRMIRANPLLLLSFYYTGGFILAFSSILNLGILARQRVQVLPFFLALLVALGWPPDPEPDETTPSARTAIRSKRAELTASSFRPGLDVTYGRHERQPHQVPYSGRRR